MYLIFRVHQTILPPSTNSNQNPGGSKDYPCVSPSIGCYTSHGNKKLKSSNSIQENNNSQKKIVEQTYYKVLSAVVDELLHLLLTVFTPHVHLHKKLHWGRLTSKSCSR